MKNGIRAMLFVFWTMALAPTGTSANPVMPGGITEFSVDPDWIEVNTNPWPFGVNRPIIIDGKEVAIDWDAVAANENFGRQVVFDSTNTSGFDLKPEGGYIYISVLSDTLFYGPGQMCPSPLPGESISLNGEWQYRGSRYPWNFDPTPTPREPNDAPDPKYGSGTVFINEVFPGSEGQPAFIELYNRGDSPADIGGYSLITLARYRVPGGTVIPARGFFTLSAPEFPVGFALSPEGGTVYIQNDRYELVDQMGWPGGMEAGISVNRVPDGLATEFRGYDYATSLDFREGNASPDATNSGFPILSMSMEKTNDLLCPGARKQYCCRGTDSRGRTARMLPEWSIRGGFAEVDGYGVVTGIRCGEGVLTAQYEAFTDTLFIRGAAGGSLLNDAVWKNEYNPYRVESQFWIGNGVTLRIEPGVVIDFYGDSPVYVSGTLLCMGNAEQPISFSAQPPRDPDRSSGINFYGGSSILKYCMFDRTETQINITEYADSTKVSHCVFRGGKNSILISGEAIIEHNLLVGSFAEQEPGIRISRMAREGTWEWPGTARVVNNTLIDWNKGITIDRASETVIRNNIISNCTTGIDGSADIAHNCIAASNPFVNGPEGAGVLSGVNARGTACDAFRNIFVNPGFTDAAGGDYRLAANSPCIDAGDPSILDEDGSVSDLGMYGGGGDIVPVVEEREDDALPRTLRVERNYPNPFNPSTTIGFTLPEEGRASLTVYAITGGKVRELVSGALPAGKHEARWDGRDDRGHAVSSGVYLVRLTQKGRVSTAKMLLIK